LAGMADNDDARQARLCVAVRCAEWQDGAVLGMARRGMAGADRCDSAGHGGAGMGDVRTDEAVGASRCGAMTGRAMNGNKYRHYV
jgi:hypothetical protein